MPGILVGVDGSERLAWPWLGLCERPPCAMSR